VSILKDLAVIFGVVLFLSLLMFGADRSGYARGKADAESACTSANSLAMYEQLQKVADLNEQNIATVERAAAEAAEADQALDAHLTATVKHLEKLRAQTIPVGADCRRPYDVVRMYQRAASGPSAGGGSDEAASGVPALGDGPVPAFGDARD
jgi:hypothetical protein